MWRNKLQPVAVASLISGVIGGLGFAGIQWIKQIMLSFGSPRILAYIGRIPGIDFLNMTPESWFTLTWGLLAAACIIIVVRHYKSPLPIIPKSSLATNRMIYHYPTSDKLNNGPQSHTRFGPDASWRTKPNLKKAEEHRRSILELNFFAPLLQETDNRFQKKLCPHWGRDLIFQL